MSERNETIVVGDEYDEKRREILLEVLRSRGAEFIDKESSVAGSQEIESLAVDINGNLVTVEAETFIGLTISGPKDIVEDVVAEVNRKMARLKAPGYVHQ